MSEAKEKVSETKEKELNIQPVSWVAPFVFSIILQLISVVMLMVGMNSYEEDTVALCWGVSAILAIASIFVFISFIKELIAESNVRALEVFYGKERKVKFNNEEIDE